MRRRWTKQLSLSLAAVMLLCGGCGDASDAGNTTPGTEQGSVTLQPDADTEPTKAAEVTPTKMPEATPTEEPEATPTEAASPTEEPAVIPTGAPEAEITMPVVSPMPQSDVVDIAGSIAPEAYPVVDGSTATLPLSQAVYQLATGADAAAAEAAVVHTKTTNSYYRLYDGEADLLIVYEPPMEVIERMQTEELLVKPIGLDALVFMANSANPVESLTTEQLVDIYSGNIKNWAEVGGAEQEMLAFQRPAGSGSQSLMQKLVMKDVPMENGDNVYRYSTMSDILEGMLAYTGEDNTLGYSVFYYANFMYSLPELRFMAVNGVTPSTQTIYDGSYPFINAFYAVIRPDEPEDSNARRIFNWLTGEAGQQLVLDMGYVPVVMPEGAEIGSGEQTSGQEVLVTPQQNLAPGEHFLLYQEQDNVESATLRVYDEEWNCCAVFRNVSTGMTGVTPARYITMARLQPGGEQEGFIYDLERQEEVVFEGGVRPQMVLDNIRGYFVFYDWSDIDSALTRIVDREGNLILEHRFDLYESLMFWREDDYYAAHHWPYNSKGGTGEVIEIFDMDLKLKTILYNAAEDMPAEEERIEGVAYELIEGGSVVSNNGDVLLNVQRFTDKFGEGECVINGGSKYSYDDSWEKHLFEVQFNGETWYIDSKLNAYFKVGEEKLTILDPQEATALVYSANTEDGARFFDAEGNPLYMSDNQVPENVYTCGNESYLMVRQTKTGFDVEEVVPADHYRKLQSIAINRKQKYFDEYLAPYCFTLTGRESGADGYSVVDWLFCSGEQVETLTSRGFILAESQEEFCRIKDGTWCLRIDNGDKLELSYEGLDGDKKVIKDLYTYAIIRDGKITFQTSEPGDLISCHGGYLQVNSGNYTYVYDYNGNQIIKAYNHMLVEE